MSSGTTKPSYTRDEKLLLLFQFHFQACEAFTKAQKRIEEKLKKEGITLDEFVKYSIAKEKELKQKGQNDGQATG